MANHFEITKLLVKRGADSKLVDSSGNTALDTAIQYASTDCARILEQV
jgi:ankyrin repeat protein